MNLDAQRFHKMIALLEEFRLQIERCKILSLRIEEELKACIPQ